MKKFIKKSVIQKIIFAVLITVLCSIVIPNYVNADITVEPKGGGTLFNPVKNLLTAIGDAFLNLIQSTVFTQDGSKMSAAAEGLTFNVTPGDKARDGGNWWDDSNDNNVAYPGYLYLTPEAIFSNKISILDADFVNPIENYDEYIDGNKYEDGITKLRKTIAKWYVGLRNFALVGLLSVLVYVGIRIILSSTAGEKAKYKQMITYWVSAIALLFVLHYIMSFTFLITDKITQIFSGLNGNKAITTQNVGKEGGDNTFTINDDSDKTEFSNFLSGEYSDIQGQILSGDKITGVANLTQYARLYANITGTIGFRYLVVYIALVAYTVYFFFIYTKRVIYLAFLTLIAPLITLTYPIDKLNDGQAQAFNVWIKEFIFNVLLQPFHLLIYTIFIGMAIEFANSNLVYTVVAIAFILPAEKLLRKMFGFDKASTSSAFSGAAAGSMLATAISKAGGKASSKGGSGGDKGGSGSSGEKPPRTGTETDPYSAYGNEDGNGNNNSEEQLPEGTDNNATNNNENRNNNNNTSNTTNNSNTNTNDDVPEWREDLTEQEIADRDNLLNQRTASESFAEQDRENGDYVSADEMERQAQEQDRQLDRYRPQQEQIGEQGEQEDEIRQQEQTEEQEEEQGEQILQQDQTEGQENEREQPLLQPNQTQNQQQEEQGEQIRQQEQTGEQEEEQEREQTPEQAQTEEEREQIPQLEQQQTQQQIQQPVQQQTQEPSMREKIGRGLKNVAGKAGRKIGDKTGMRKINGFGEMTSKQRRAAIGRELWNGAKTIAPKALKAGTRYALAGSAAILAGSAALISGDPKSVLSAATLAGKGGANIGNRIGDKTVSGITSASNTFMKGYHGEKYDSIKNEQYARQQAYSSETADAMLTAFGQDKQQEAMEAAYEMRLATGVDDNKSIIAALSTTKQFGGDKVKDEDAVELSAAKNMPLMDKYMDDGIFNDYKKYETQKKKISKALQSKHPGINSNQANREAEKALRDYAKYKGKHLAIPGQSDSAEGSGGRRKFRATN